MAGVIRHKRTPYKSVKQVPKTLVKFKQTYRQHGIFTKDKDAKQIAVNLRKGGYPAQVVPIQIGNDKPAVVYIGMKR